jgi:hypothetical protein
LVITHGHVNDDSRRRHGRSADSIRVFVPAIPVFVSAPDSRRAWPA